MCCNPWSHRESDTTEELNNNKRQKYLLTILYPITGQPQGGEPRVLLWQLGSYISQRGKTVKIRRVVLERFHHSMVTNSIER